MASGCDSGVIVGVTFEPIRWAGELQPRDRAALIGGLFLFRPVTGGFGRWAVIGTAFGVLRLGLNLPVSATLGAAIAMAWFFIAIAINLSAASYYARLRNRLTPP